MSSSLVPALLPLGAFAAAVVCAVLAAVRPAAARPVAIAVGVGLNALAWIGLVRAVDGETLRHRMGGWAAPVGIEYVLDPLAGLVAVLITTIALLVLAYPVRIGFGVELSRGLFLHALVLLLVGGLLGVAMAGDLFNLFVSLEIYSIASYALISLGGRAAAVASFRYLILGTMGSSLYLLGVGYLYFTTGSLSMATVADSLGPLTGSPTLAAATALIVIGLGIKMALFPLHVWLPDAHSHAPPAVAALLASVQVKVAAYALIRILFDVLPPGYALSDVPVLTLLTWFGAAGVVVGSAMAIRQRDIKRMLAHSTVAQVGYIALGIGLANPLALTGALLHVVNHAVMKACLFFVAGGVLDRAGTKEISGYAGLGARMPRTMAAFTVAAISMVGLPPTAGFFSKWYLVSGALDAGNAVVAVVIVGASLLTLTYFLRMIEAIWFSPDVADGGVASPAVADASPSRPACEPSAGVLVPVGVLAVAIVVLGVANGPIVEQVLDPIATRLAGPP